MGGPDGVRARRAGTAYESSAVGRLGVAQIPKPDLVVQEGDIAYVALAGDAIAAFDARLAEGGGPH